MSKLTLDVLIEYLEECEINLMEFNKWERNFIYSMREKVDGGIKLTENMQDTLEKLFLRCPG